MDIKVAHALSMMSNLVYKDEGVIEEQVDEWGFSDFTFFDTMDTQACVVADDERCIVAFRGTESVRDWLTDMDVFQSPGPYGRVHHGFQEALDAVWSDLISVIDFDKRLFVTGHSLGAALATLTVARLDYGKLYTFGSPRVGDKEFAEHFDIVHRSYRFVNNNDIVTRVPLTRFKHIGSLRYFTVNEKMWIEPSKYWLRYDRIVGRCKRPMADGIKDHSMENYEKLVKKQLTTQKSKV